MAPFFSPARRASFRALAETFVPETVAASSAEWAEAEATVERFVMTRPRALRRQLNALIGFLEIAARL
ncbi:MAG: hypothetical protein ACT4PM_02500, partial [Gemmatimonadales bacterium]